MTQSKRDRPEDKPSLCQRAIAMRVTYMHNSQLQPLLTAFDSIELVVRATILLRDASRSSTAHTVRRPLLK